MRRTVWESKKALCPFYRCEDSYSVFCDGLFGGQYIRSCFTSPAQRKSYADRYCCKDWESCFFSDSKARSRAAEAEDY